MAPARGTLWRVNSPSETGVPARVMIRRLADAICKAIRASSASFASWSKLQEASDSVALRLLLLLRGSRWRDYGESPQNEKRRSRRHPTRGVRKRLYLLMVKSMVRKGGLEPPRPKALPPQDSVSTNFTTPAKMFGLHTPLTGAGPKPVPRRHHRFREWERRKVPEPPKAFPASL